MKLTILTISAICVSAGYVAAFEDEKAVETKVETTEVELGDLKLQVPSTWKKDDKPNSMRLATYFTPSAEGDKDPGELSISTFPGGGGGVGPNIERWVGQFSGEGKTAKVTKGKAGDNEYYLVEITGTFAKSVGPPVLRQTEAAEGYRMLGAIVVLEGKGVYFLKLTGPDASIKAQQKLFRQSFGARNEAEVDYEL